MMNVDQTISDLSTLSVGDRLRVVHAIWDTLPDDVCDGRLGSRGGAAASASN